MTIELSVVVPVFNEAESLPALLADLRRALDGLPSTTSEAVLVDDGSTDGSWDVLRAAAARDPRLRLVRFKRNYGQTPALAAGFQLSRGSTVVCLDADGQNDPADIPALLEEVRRGADVVSGWRRERRDPWLTRRLPSRAANLLISVVTGVYLHDYGCTLKAYRREALEGLRLYGEMHRFLPAWCAWRGAVVKELPVRHHPRRKGRSKYGLLRTIKVLLDLVTAKFFSAYLNKPSYFFGGAGLVLVAASFLSGLFPVIDKLWIDRWGPLRVPFMILCIFLGLLGAQFIVLGLLAEIVIRIYYENKDERPYRIAEVHPPADDDRAGPA
jgi:glycosyltransferase involved in cell wall biosynthesis